MRLPPYKSKRMFVGLELPERCRETLATIDPKLRGVRWTGRAQLHLTMSFLGDVTVEDQPRLKEALSTVTIGRFFLPIQGVGTFGGARPSVLWAGVGKGHPHLFALHKRIQDAVCGIGLAPDLRSFHPHITLARMRGVAAAVLRPFLREYEAAEFGLWEVKDFVLYSSEATDEGSVYSVELRQGLE